MRRPGVTVDLLTQEGPDNVRQCISQLKSTRPLTALSMSRALSQAAQSHVDDTGPSGVTGHTGTNGSKFGDRIKRFGEWGGTIGEIIDYGNNNAEDIVVSLLIDDGVPSRGHRTSILNGEFIHAGVGIGGHRQYEFMCVIDLAKEIIESGSTTVAPSQPRVIAKSSNSTENQTVKSTPVSTNAIVSAGINQEILQELNLCRSNPSRYSEKLSKMLPLYNGNLFRRPGKIPIRTNEGSENVKECINQLKATSPMPPLRHSSMLALAAKAHTEDTGPKGTTGHTGSDGSDPFERIQRFGEWMGSAGEIIDYGGDTAEAVVIDLLIDDGVPSRGHRTSILTPTFLFAGVSYGPHSIYEHMCVVDLAQEVTERESLEEKKIAARTGPTKSPISDPRAEKTIPTRPSPTKSPIAPSRDVKKIAAKPSPSKSPIAVPRKEKQSPAKPSPSRPAISRSSPGQ